MTTTTRVKHILFVDDDPGARLIVETMLRARLPGVRVTTAVDGAQALVVLGRNTIDLMITDLAMPVMDGVELLLNVARRRILVPVLVVTANGSPAAETAALAGGAIEYFEKPIEESRFVRCVQDLLAASGGRSQLEVVSLAGIVRLINTDRRTCSLQVTSAEAQGVLLFAAGDLVDARQGELSGLPAALTILAWDEVTMNLDIKAQARARTIHASATEVLQQASRRGRPGARALQGEQPRARAEWIPAPNAAPAPLAAPTAPGSNPTPIRPMMATPGTAQPPRLAAPTNLTNRAPSSLSPRSTPPVPAPPRTSAARRPGEANGYATRTATKTTQAPPTANHATPTLATPQTPPGEAPDLVRATPLPAIEPTISAEPSISVEPTISVEASPAVEPTISAESSPAAEPTTPVATAPAAEPTIPVEPAASTAPTVEPTIPIATAPAVEPAASTPPTIPAEPVQAESSAAAIDYTENDTYYDLVERARDRLRAAEFEAAERLLRRALEVQPGDRVAEQNLRVLARRRGAGGSGQSFASSP